MELFWHNRLIFTWTWCSLKLCIVPAYIGSSPAYVALSCSQSAHFSLSFHSLEPSPSGMWMYYKFQQVLHAPIAIYHQIHIIPFQFYFIFYLLLNWKLLMICLILLNELGQRGGGVKTQEEVQKWVWMWESNGATYTGLLLMQGTKFLQAIVLLSFIYKKLTIGMFAIGCWCTSVAH